MYKKKYLKYKTKYLELKNQLGGTRGIVTYTYKTSQPYRSFVPTQTAREAREARRVQEAEAAQAAAKAVAEAATQAAAEAKRAAEAAEAKRAAEAAQAAESKRAAEAQTARREQADKELVVAKENYLIIKYPNTLLKDAIDKERDKQEKLLRKRIKLSYIIRDNLYPNLLAVYNRIHDRFKEDYEMLPRFHTPDEIKIIYTSEDQIYTNYKKNYQKDKINWEDFMKELENDIAYQEQVDQEQEKLVTEAARETAAQTEQEKLVAQKVEAAREALAAQTARREQADKELVVAKEAERVAQQAARVAQQAARASQEAAEAQKARREKADKDVVARKKAVEALEEAVRSSQKYHEQHKKHNK
jgi:hypothetical protein